MSAAERQRRRRQRQRENFVPDPYRFQKAVRLFFAFFCDDVAEVINRRSGAPKTEFDRDLAAVLALAQRLAAAPLEPLPDEPGL